MAPTNPKYSTEELVDAQSHIWNHIFHFINSMSLKCTVQLGIPDIIHHHGKPMMLSELTNALSINEAKSSCIERLMRAMIHSRFFVKAKISDKEGDKEGYWLTPSSFLLLKDEPMSVAPFVVMLDPILMDPWHNLSEWFGTNHASPFFATHGTDVWEKVGKDARLSPFFNEGMACDSRLMSRIIVKDFGHVFKGLKSMVDLGGGTGTMAKCIVDAFPGLKGIVLDLPHVVAGLKEFDNLTYVAGNMLESIPRADAVLLKWILSDWPDSECVKILKKCKEAIHNKEKGGGGGGKLIIIDIVMKDDEDDNDESRETHLFFDMSMMMTSSGGQRTEKEWKSVFISAGFTNYKITKMLGWRSLIEVYP